MCLMVTRPDRYNHSGIGYKLLERIKLVPYGGPQNLKGFSSMYQHAKWNNGERHAKFGREKERRKADHEQYKLLYYGIHVFPYLKDALHCLEFVARDYPTAIVRVKVRGFLGAGVHWHYSPYGNGLAGECWKHAKIDKIIKWH